MTTPWIIAAVFAVLALFAFKPPNQVGGGLTLGAIGGTIYAVFFAHGGFQILLVLKWAIVAVLISYVMEVVYRFGRAKSGNPIDD